ncbi:MAG: hypothetical protein HZB53_20275 [Chloroflexi bacterium]|nr:hypothetical protein [Chloroflexota bacterium]
MVADNQPHAVEPIHRVGTVVDVIITLGALVAFNAFPDRIGIYAITSDQLRFEPLVAPGFWAFMPWLNMIWGMALVIGVANLWLGRWTVPVRALDMTRDLLTILVMALMIAGDPLVVSPGLDIGLRVLVAIALFAVIADLVGKAGRLSGSGTHLAPPRSV